MFWWSVPLSYTGLLIAGISLAIMFVVCLLVGDAALDDARGFIYVMGAGAMFVLIGLAMALIGFCFWTLGAIWSPYV